MSSEFEINAQSREDAGKGASRRLRRTEHVPGVVYGGKSKPQMISLVHNELMQHLENEAFYSHILNLNIDGKSEQVILKDLQRHPAKALVLHADFQRVSAKSKLRTNIPLHFIGEDDAPGIKMGGAISHNITSVEVLCLPKDLPEFIEVDMSAMEIGSNVHMSELNLPKGVEIPALAQGGEQNMIVVTLHSGHGGMEEEATDDVEDGVEAAPDGEDSEG
ncbi:MAG: 50S ribosomal protein L25/general stress protein Ctc [Gammaproteobacteria bacterium]|nr:50S ribosomal protein L25/general stress protein Ctc [Gammaproteobacteria bacterium]